MWVPPHVQPAGASDPALRDGGSGPEPGVVGSQVRTLRLLAWPLQVQRLPPQTPASLAPRLRALLAAAVPGPWGGC